MKNKLLVFLFLAILKNAYAQEISEPPILLEKKDWMFEYFFSVQNTDGNQNLGLANFTFRRGISERFEAVAFLNYNLIKQSGTQIEGFSPLILSLKTKLLEQKGLIPETSVLTGIQLPQTAGRDLRPHHLAFNGIVTTNHNFSSFHWTNNYILFWDGFSHHPWHSWTSSLGNYLKDNHKIYVEAYANTHPSISTTFNWQVGTEYIINEVYFFNISGGTSFNSIRNIYLSAGFNYLLKNKKN